MKTKRVVAIIQYIEISLPTDDSANLPCLLIQLQIVILVNCKTETILLGNKIIYKNNYVYNIIIIDK